MEYIDDYKKKQFIWEIENYNMNHRIKSLFILISFSILMSLSIIFLILISGNFGELIEILGL